MRIFLGNECTHVTGLVSLAGIVRHINKFWWTVDKFKPSALRDRLRLSLNEFTRRPSILINLLILYFDKRRISTIFEGIFYKIIFQLQTHTIFYSQQYNMFWLSLVPMTVSQLYWNQPLTICSAKRQILEIELSFLSYSAFDVYTSQVLILGLRGNSHNIHRKQCKPFINIQIVEYTSNKHFSIWNRSDF